MSELKSAFSPVFNEAGFETRLDWDLSRREFSESLKRLFEELRKHGAAIPLPVAADVGPVTCLLAAIDCKGCGGNCCTRRTRGVLLSPAEAAGLGIKGAPGTAEPASLPLPCKFFKKDQCSVYLERPAACRIYPVQIGGSAKGDEVILGLDSQCPEASRIALRVYLVAYDLAHTKEDKTADVPPQRKAE